MNETTFQERLDRLIAGDLSEADHAELQDHLKQNSEARRRFRERMDLEASLRTWAGEAAPPKPETRASDAASNHLARWVIVGVALAASVLLLINSFRANDLPENKTVVNRPPDVRFVGRLLAQPDCRWDSMPALEDARFAAGTFALAEGAAEFRFDSGTEVVIEGPCRLQVTSADTASLLAGSAYVNVTEVSNGFMLATPESQIFDEGTEYAVAVEEQSTEVHVYDGTVVWVSAVSSEQAVSAEQASFEDRIEAGEARRYDRNTPNIGKRIPFGQRQFVRRIELEIREQAGDALLAYDGFENLAGRVRRGRSGFGWDGGWQPARSARGQIAEIVEADADVVFGHLRTGRRLMALSAGGDIRRMLIEPVDLPMGALYVSLLIQNVARDGEEHSLRIALEPDLPGRGRNKHAISFGFTDGGLPFLNSGNQVVTAALPVPARDVCFCILKIPSSSDGVPCWRVYGSGESVDVTEPASWTLRADESNNGRGGTRLPINSIRVSAGDDANWQLDELKIGRSWESVTSRPSSVQSVLE